MKGKKRARAFIAALLLSAVAALALAGVASAHLVYPYEFEKSFKGTDSTAGAMTTAVHGITINQANGNVYVLDEHNGHSDISQFNESGVAQFWSALEGTTTIELPASGSSDLLFDNITGENLGLFVVNDFGENHLYRAYNTDGTPRITFGELSGGQCGLGIYPGGLPQGFPNAKVVVGTGQFTSTYNAKTGAVEAFFNPEGKSFLYEQAPCHQTVDNNDEVWTNRSDGLRKYGKPLEDFWTFPQFGDNSKVHVSYNPTQMSAVDPGTDNIYAIENENHVTEYSDQGQPILEFGLPEGPYPGMQHSFGLTVNGTNHKVYVTSDTATEGRVDIFKQGTPYTVPDATTLQPGHPSGTTAILKGLVNPDGGPTTECKFEWGTTTRYLNGELPCEQNGSPAMVITSEGVVEHEVKSLTLGNTYHFRFKVKNANGHWSYGADRAFQAQTPPTNTPLIVEKINTDAAHFHAKINPHGGITSWYLEIGKEDCSVSTCTPVQGAAGKLASNMKEEEVEATALHLEANTLYHVRLVAENEAGTATSSGEFRTYPAPSGIDNCPNANVRKQTGASLLLECRAYELVSAANAGGYDVESDLIPGQTPFDAYPAASDRVLYGLHYGSVPGIAGSPPNYGVDPYVAERTASGWVTRYVGIPANGMADHEAFGSPLLGADEGLNDFAFGGKGICNPCFEGHGTNLPIRLDGGPAEPGMVGSKDPGESEPEGAVAKYLSADGSHLVFGSSKEFEEDGLGNVLRIYERDLSTGGTEIASTDESGETIDAEVAELDLSSNGSRVLVGEEAFAEGENTYYQLYMHFAGNPDSVQLTPGPALFDGMTADGSRVFFTSTENLAGDTDESADIFEVEVAPNGSVSAPRLISTMSNGSPSNDDSCTPPGSPDSWNAASGEEGKCNALALAGGAGVASGDGTFYFLSPEQLDNGKGSANQANLYVVEPGGSPSFVAVMDSSEGKPTAEDIPPKRPLVTSNLTGTTLSGPAGVAIDESNGDIYVDQSNGKVARFTAAGAPHKFTAGTGSGTNEIPGQSLPSTEGENAVDNSSSPLSGDLYVTTNGSAVNVFAPSGEQIGSITEMGEACGVAVEQSTGAVYVGDYSGGGRIWRFMPKPTAAAPIENSDYTKTGIATTGVQPCNVAVDSAGHAYALRYSNGPVYEYDTSLFTEATPSVSGTEIDKEGRGISTDPTTNRLFVTEQVQIAEFKPNGELLQRFGTGGGRGVAISGATHHVYTPSGSNLAEFGYEPLPYIPIDNPAIRHAALESGTHRMSDFQITPDGRYAVFASARSLTGYENVGHSEIYRFDAQSGELECVSCATTLAPARSDTFLSSHGLNITDDGRVFFTTAEGLVLSDTNEKLDAYEWTGGLNVDKVSTGRSSFDSKLLSVSRDGRDAYFFTRDVLVPTDENGGAVKIYDAREGGGYLHIPKSPPCAASDECHGPGTPQPPPPNINSITGAGETTAPGGTNGKKPCKKGKVRKHGKCVKKAGKHRHHHRRGKHARHNHRAGRNG